MNAICPGYVDTELARAGIAQRASIIKKDPTELAKIYVDNIPQRRAILAEECVDAVLFFCSDGGGRTTGEALNISGRAGDGMSTPEDHHRSSSSARTSPTP